MLKKTGLWLVYGSLVLMLASCSFFSSNPAPTSKVLAEFTESFVKVTISLEPGEESEAVLLATFSPIETDAHLYSKELPREGVEGLGRPTLIELPVGAHMQVAGELQESVSAVEDAVAPDLPTLPVYPMGPVTLRLPVLLPEGKGGLVDDQVLITYMVCTPRGCHKPVVGLLVGVRVPVK
jgi:hypothetical protein